MKMKRCPNCGGSLFVDWDILTDKWTEVCILCGYKEEAVEVFRGKIDSSANQEVAAEKKKRIKKRRRPKSEGWLM